MKNNKVVLAFSGGLDTSYCIPYLSREKGLEVHALTVNTGGFSSTELQEIEKRAFALGAASFQVIEAEEIFYQQCIRYLIFGNVLKNNTYPLSVSAERVFQAIQVMQYAQQIGAGSVAHGSTGAGNDQVRFDLIFEIFGNDLQIITPIRDQQLSRQAEITYLQELGFNWSWEKAQYSVNQGLWGTSVGGAETLTSHQALPETAFPSPLKNHSPQKISLEFEKGELIGIDDQRFASPVAAIKTLEKMAAPFAIGRDTHVGDTIIGIKGRVGFEAASAMIILKAHHLLEKHVLGKWQQHWKEQLANWYGMLLHEGQYHDPVMRNIEVFLEATQERVTGQVLVELLPYRFNLLGIHSDFDLMNAKFGQYGEMNKAWSAQDVKGFTKILANAPKIYHSMTAEKVSL